MSQKIRSCLSNKILLPFAIFLGFAAQHSYAQTILSPGDLVIVTANADTPKSFDFIPLVHLDKGTVIKFTDDEWDHTTASFEDSEGILAFTASSAIPAGTVISFSGTPGNGFIETDGGFNPSASGDNILVYQGEAENPTILYGIGWGKGTVWETSGLSDIPSGLSLENNTILSLGTSANYQYNAENGVEGTPASLLALVGDESNWAENDDEAFPAFQTNFVLGTLPTLQYVTPTIEAKESDGFVTISVELLEANSTATSVEIVFIGALSTASLNDINNFSTQEINFNADEVSGSTKNITVTLNSDTDFEGNETAVFWLQNLSAGSIVGGKAVTVNIKDDDQPKVVINEFLADPGDYDTNGMEGDGTNDNEFIEILNNEEVSIDISGWTIWDKNDVKYIFPEGTILQPRSAAVVFGSEDFQGIFGGSIVKGTSSLSLNNSDEQIILQDSTGFVIDSITYSSAEDDQSSVRSPEGTGEFVAHSTVSSDPFSPGIKANGSNFDNSLTVEGTAGWRMLSIPYENMPYSELDSLSALQGFTGFNPDDTKNLYNYYADSSFSFETPQTISGTHVPGRGIILYFFNNNNGGSSKLPVNFKYEAGAEPDNPAPVSLHQEGAKWNLLGNPFSTAIDISNIGEWLSAGDSLASNIAQIWDNASKSYILSTNNDNKIEAWQGFFIQNANASYIDFPASAKTSGTRFYKEHTQDGYLTLQLEGRNPANGAQTVDKALFLYFHKEAAIGWDVYDAIKLLPPKGFVPNYALLSIRGVRKGKAVAKAQDSRNINFEGEIEYNIDVLIRNMSGDFELSWKKKHLPDTWNFILIDNQTGSEVDMLLHHSYNFSLSDVNQQPAIKAKKNSATEPVMPVVAAADLSKENEPRFTIIVSRNKVADNSTINQPESIKLNPNYPNPFRQSTTVPFELAEDAEVTLTVWNMIGQKVATLVDGMQEAGVHTDVRWNASNMPSGMYIARLEVEGEVFIRKMTLIK